ncbi:histidine phosphatase family protein [Dietzia sp.]|uniref:histidine phosphatase family protein n=1 Tax=Dietzia sp. TaxID=1871616 RepID=UPI002FDB8CA8
MAGGGPLRLRIVAHAATEATHAGRFALDDDGLSRAGRAAASWSGGEPTGLRARRVLCAPERRARETAELLGLATPQIDMGSEFSTAFRDLDLGDWAGRGVGEIALEDLAAWNTEPDYSGHGGESITGHVARVGAALDELGGGAGSARDREDLGSDGAEDFVLVAHPATLRSAVIHALSAPAAAFFRIDAGPGHELRLHRRGTRWTLRLPR